MQPTQPIYPDLKLKNTQPCLQSVSANNISPCIPVAIISHSTDITLVTCSKEVTGEGQLVCQHNEYGSHAHMPLHSLIQNLQQRGVSVYTLNSDGITHTTHLYELTNNDLLEEMDTSDEAFVATPQDLDAHSIDEALINQLLVPEAIEPLVFTEQNASASSVPAASAAPSTSSLPTTSAAPAQRRRSRAELTLETIPVSEKKMIYALLDILSNTSQPIQKRKCMDLIAVKYSEFTSISGISSYNNAFTSATRFNLIKMTGHQHAPDGVVYEILDTGKDFIRNYSGTKPQLK